MAIAVLVNVDTYTETPRVIGRIWHNASPNTQDFRKADRGVNGTASRHIMISLTAKFEMKIFVIVCMDLFRTTTKTTSKFPDTPTKKMTV